MKRIICIVLLTLIVMQVCSQKRTRVFDQPSFKCCVRVDEQLMTADEYDNWLYKNHPNEYASDPILYNWMKRHLGPEPDTESRDYQKCVFATRAFEWAGQKLTAWAVVDEYEQQCSFWVFAGSADSGGCWWWLENADEMYVRVTLALCADTICWTWGRVDKYGNLYTIRFGEDHDYYVPWDWDEWDRNNR